MQGGPIMTQIIDTSSNYEKEWFCNKGYSVEIREEEDIIKIKHKGKVVSEIVCFLGSGVCYFVTGQEEESQSCNLEKETMVIAWNIATILLLKEKEGTISFSIGI